MEKKKRSVWWIWLLLIIVGTICLVAGVLGMNYVDPKTKLEKEDFTVIYKDDIQNLEIESGVCKFNIVRTDNDYISLEGVNVPKGRYTEKVIGNTLKIQYHEKRILGFINVGTFIKEMVGEITLYLPEKEYRSLEFDAGVGVNRISDLTLRELDFDGGVGEYYLDNITVYGETDFDLGVGETEMTDCILNVSDIDVGVGDMTFAGQLWGDTNVDTGVGDVVLNIDGYKDEFIINTDKGVGDIDINEGTNTVADDYEPRSKYLDLDCGVGDVTVNFK